MSKLPICERVSIKSFIKVLRAYGLDQQRPSNIEGLKNFKSKNTSPNRSTRTNFAT
jgi:hypothetical protein